MKIAQQMLRKRMISKALMSKNRPFFSFTLPIKRIKWLWDIVDVVLPSVYLNTKITAPQRVQFVRGRMREGNRVAKMSQKSKKPPVLGYLRYVYTNTLDFISNVSVSNSVIE